jgi:hypothetical protein
LFRIDNSALLFQGRACMIKDPIDTVWTPGVVATVGHGNIKASHFGDSIDVVLLGIGGPEYYGPELVTQKIKADRPISIPVLVGLNCLGIYLAFFQLPQIGAAARNWRGGQPLA